MWANPDPGAADRVDTTEVLDVQVLGAQSRDQRCLLTERDPPADKFTLPNLAGDVLANESEIERARSRVGPIRGEEFFDALPIDVAPGRLGRLVIGRRTQSPEKC